MAILEHVEYLSDLAPSGETDAASLLPDQVSLAPFLRALLVADGTVTVLLRAYFNEDVLISAEEQSAFTLQRQIPALRLNPGDEAFYRRVVLRGGDTGVAYASAISILNPAVLPERLFEALIRDNVGMGDVLRNAAKGSYREILDIRPLADDIERTYLVYLDGLPGILISELFDKSVFD